MSLFTFLVKSIAATIAENKELNSIRSAHRIVEFEDVDVSVPIELTSAGEANSHQIVSIIMAGSHVFSRLTAAMGITANVLALGYFPALVFVPPLCALPPSISAPFRLAWYIMIALRLFKLTRGTEVGGGGESGRGGGDSGYQSGGA